MTIDYDAIWGETWSDMQDLGPVHRLSARIIVETVRRLDVHSIVDLGYGNGANVAAPQFESSGPSTLCEEDVLSCPERWRQLLIKQWRCADDPTQGPMIDASDESRSTARSSPEARTRETCGRRSAAREAI